MNVCLESHHLNHVLNWRLPGFGLVLGLVLSIRLMSFGRIAAGPTLFFGTTLLAVGIGIFIGATPSNHLSSKLKTFSEWTLIGVVWTLIFLIVHTILTIH